MLHGSSATPGDWSPFDRPARVPAAAVPEQAVEPEATVEAVSASLSSLANTLSKTLLPDRDPAPPAVEPVPQPLSVACSSSAVPDKPNIDDASSVSSGGRKRSAAGPPVTTNPPLGSEVIDPSSSDSAPGIPGHASSGLEPLSCESNTPSTFPPVVPREPGSTIGYEKDGTTLVATADGKSWTRDYDADPTGVTTTGDKIDDKADSDGDDIFGYGEWDHNPPASKPLPSGFGTDPPCVVTPKRTVHLEPDLTRNPNPSSSLLDKALDAGYNAPDNASRAEAAFSILAPQVSMAELTAGGTAGISLASLQAEHQFFRLDGHAQDRRIDELSQALDRQKGSLCGQLNRHRANFNTNCDVVDNRLGGCERRVTVLESSLDAAHVTAQRAGEHINSVSQVANKALRRLNEGRRRSTSHDTLDRLVSSEKSASRAAKDITTLFHRSDSQSARVSDLEMGLSSTTDRVLAIENAESARPSVSAANELSLRLVNECDKKVKDLEASAGARNYDLDVIRSTIRDIQTELRDLRDMISRRPLDPPPSLSAYPRSSSPTRYYPYSSHDSRYYRR